MRREERKGERYGDVWALLERGIRLSIIRRVSTHHKFGRQVTPYRTGKRDLLCDTAEGVAGDGGRYERISVRRVASDLPAAVMKAAMSKATFFLGVEKDMNSILLFDIWFDLK